MNDQHTDWKDVASSYYDKCLALTIIFVMFTFIVFPNIETQSFRSNEKVMESIEIPPDIPEEIKPQEEVAKPIVNIEIVDEEDISDDEEIEVIETIEETVIDMTVEVAPPPSWGETPRFVIYDEPPVILTRIAPTYPEFARRANVQGQVILDIEVFADGTIGQIEVVRSVMAGPGGLDEAAVNAARQWKFQPASSGGQPVSCWLRQPIDFRIGN